MIRMLFLKFSWFILKITAPFAHWSTFSHFQIFRFPFPATATIQMGIWIVLSFSGGALHFHIAIYIAIFSWLNSTNPNNGFLQRKENKLNLLRTKSNRIERSEYYKFCLRHVKRGRFYFLAHIFFPNWYQPLIKWCFDSIPLNGHHILHVVFGCFTWMNQRWLCEICFYMRSSYAIVTISDKMYLEAISQTQRIDFFPSICFNMHTHTHTPVRYASHPVHISNNAAAFLRLYFFHSIMDCVYSARYKFHTRNLKQQ